MKNFLQEGDVLTLTAPGGGVVSGVPVLIGSLLVVPAADAAAGLTFEGRVEGVFSYTKTDDQAWLEGQKIYWDTVAKVFTADPTLGPLVGTASAAVAVTHGLTTGKVRLNGASSPLLEGGPEAAVADLVDNGGGAGADGTIGVVTNPNLGAWDGAHDPTAAEGIAINAAITALKDAVKELSTKNNALLAQLRLNGIIAP